MRRGCAVQCRAVRRRRCARRCRRARSARRASAAWWAAAGSRAPRRSTAGTNGRAPARIGGVVEARALLDPGGVRVDLPAGRASVLGALAEDRLEALARAPHLALGPGRVARGDVVLPAHVVPAVHADLEAGVAHRAQRRRRSAGRCPGPAAACRRAACAARSARAPRCAAPCRKARPEHARIARPVWSGPRLNRKVAPAPWRLSRLDQPRHAFARAAQGVDVDLQRQLHPALPGGALPAISVAIGVEDAPQRLAHADARLPARARACVLAIFGHAVLHVLVAARRSSGRRWSSPDAHLARGARGTPDSSSASSTIISASSRTEKLLRGLPML